MPYAARVLVTLLLLLAPQWALADAYPSKPITLLVPFPPGASTDATARLLRDSLSKELNQTVIVENHGGAGGTIGTAMVANAAPDGYTLLVTVSAPITTNKFIQKNVPYDPIGSFVPVSLLAESALFLAVNPTLPVHSVAELIDYAKKNPGKLSYGTAGIGSAHHIAGQMLNEKAGIDMVHVPYPGGGPAIQDLIANHIPVAFGTAPAVLPQADAGLVRIIGTTRYARFPERPDIPAISETVPGVVTITWLGLFAPAHTPQPIIDRLNGAVRKALLDPDLVAKFKLEGMIAKASSSDELENQIKQEIAMWSDIIPRMGIRPR